MRKLIVAALALGLVFASANAALGHITVNPSSATHGDFTKLTFRTPNERAQARTIRVEVSFPEDTPIAFVSVKPVPGWTAVTERRTLDTPIEVHGAPIRDVVSKITWAGGVIDAGQFQEFEVSVGPLPATGDELVFKAIQTYDNGEVVRWIEPTLPSGEEPEHPAPVLALTAAIDDAEADDDGDGGSALAMGLSIAALVVAGAATVLAVGARRSTGSAS